jgi:hypothetical protein
MPALPRNRSAKPRPRFPQFENGDKAGRETAADSKDRECEALGRSRMLLTLMRAPLQIVRLADRSMVAPARSKPLKSYENAKNAVERTPKI